MQGFSFSLIESSLSIYQLISTSKLHMYFPLQENMQYDHCVIQTEWVSRRDSHNIISDVGSGKINGFPVPV